MDADQVMHEFEMYRQATDARIAALSDRLTQAEQTIEALRRYKQDDPNAY